MGDKRTAGFGGEAVAKLKANGQPIVLGIPDEVWRENEKRQKTAQVGPWNSQGLGVRPENRPKKDRADEHHRVLAQQTEAGRDSRTEPTPARATWG